MTADQSAPRISVIVPCYKSARTLPACLDSLLAQDFSSYEIICVNDGSPDECPQIIEDYVSRHPGLVRGRNKDNGGLWTARMSGLEIARGSYIAFLDSDDTVTTDFLSTLYDRAVEEEADVVVCGFSRTDQESGQVLSREFCEPRASFVVADDPGKTIEVNPAAWNKLFKRETLAAMPPLRTVPPIMEDLAMMLLIYLNDRTKVAFAPRSCINYMVHADSMINTVTPQQVDVVRTMLLQIRQDYLDRHASLGQICALDATVFLHMGISMSLRLLHSPGVAFAEEFRQTTDYLDGNFSTWRRSPYITPSYARNHGRSYWRLLIAQRAYKAHLISALLSAYSFFTSTMGIDIKW